MLHCTKLRGRVGAAVTWFAAHDRLSTLHDFGGAPSGLRVRRRGRYSGTLVHCTKLWLSARQIFGDSGSSGLVWRSPLFSSSSR